MRPFHAITGAVSLGVSLTAWTVGGLVFLGTRPAHPQAMPAQVMTVPVTIFCMPAAALDAAMAQAGERRMLTGQLDPRRILSLFVNHGSGPDGGAFSIVVEEAGGPACVIAHGADLTPATPGAPKPAGRDG